MPYYPQPSGQSLPPISDEDAAGPEERPGTRPHYAEPLRGMFGPIGRCRICDKPIQEFGALWLKRWEHVS